MLSSDGPPVSESGPAVPVKTGEAAEEVDVSDIKIASDQGKSFLAFTKMWICQLLLVIKPSILCGAAG
jgi:hypothetical protein